MNRISKGQLLSVTVVVIIYASFITAAFGIHKESTPTKLSDYEQGKRIGARAVKDYLIETGQLKNPVLISPLRIRNIEDSLELNIKP